MAKKLYVGNLPFSTDDTALLEHFTQAGQVESARVIINKANGRSKGFGFVEMVNDSEADAAITRFNGTDLGGRSIVVSEARPFEPSAERRPSGDFGGGFGGGRRNSFGDRDRGFGGGGRRNRYE